MSNLWRHADELMNAPIASLQFAYDELQRMIENDVNPDRYRRVMRILELVASERGFALRTETGEDCPIETARRVIADAPPLPRFTVDPHGSGYRLYDRARQKYIDRTYPSPATAQRRANKLNRGLEDL